jgi:hypothetical protein
MRTALAALALLLVGQPAAHAVPSTSASPTGPAQDRGIHKDERFGFQFKPPKDWAGIALKTNESWLTAKYLSDKSYFYTDKDIGWTMEHQPELMVIAFQLDAKKKTEVTEEEEDGIKVTTVTINNPYKDYEDFLDRTYQGGGWFVSEKEESKLGDLAVTKYEVKVEKLARTGPKRIITWIYHTADIDYAMQTEVLESEYKKLKRLVERSLKSFVEIERNGELLPKSGNTADSIQFSRKELTSGTPKERRTVRMKSQRELHDRAIAALPKDWKHEYHGDVLVLEHNQDKWADRLGGHLEMLLKWLEKEMGYFGEGEYARAPVVRVCDDQDEALAISRGVTSGTSGGWQWLSPGSEILTWKDDAGWIGYGVERVNKTLLYLWLAERDEDLHSALPEWISIGLKETIGGARQDGRKLEWRIDQYDKDNARLAVAQKRATSPRDIMRFTREEFRQDSTGAASGEARMAHYVEASMLVRFLLMPEHHKRCKQAKGLLEAYITTLGEVLVEVKDKENDSWSSEDSPKTEEEEDERAKARSERWRAREKELMDETFDRVFGDWTDKDWAVFEKAFFDWLS